MTIEVTAQDLEFAEEFFHGCGRQGRFCVLKIDVQDLAMLVATMRVRHESKVLDLRLMLSELLGHYIEEVTAPEELMKRISGEIEPHVEELEKAARMRGKIEADDGAPA